MVLSPLNGLRTALLAVGGRWLVLKGLMQAGALSGAAAALRSVGAAVLGIGRALLLTPIGLAATVIAGTAYLVWKNWDRLGPMFARLLGGVKETMAGAVAWFKGLPAQMAAIGGEIINGLISGIRQKLAAAGEAIKSVGASVRDTFKGMLGIRSPSRVFAEMGGNLSEGLSLGMTAKLGAVTKAAAGMAAAASVSVAAAGVPEVAVPRPGVAAGGGAGVVVHYAPVLTINVTGPEHGAVRQQAEQALSMSLVEFEKMMRRYEAERSRRAVK